MAKRIHLFTVDTEFSSHPGELGVTGRVGGEEVGALTMGRLCAEAGVKATFFMDVYIDDPARGRLLRETGLRLQENGHDLQLHAHPDHL